MPSQLSFEGHRDEPAGQLGVVGGCLLLLALLAGWVVWSATSTGPSGRSDDQIGCALFWPIDRTAEPGSGVMTIGQQGHRPLVEVLHVPDCPHYRGALALVEQVLAELGIDAELRTNLIGDQAAAERTGFPGSPTIRVDGCDVEPGTEPPASYALACRLYRHEHGPAGQPAENWIRDALWAAAGRTDAPPAP
jgi:hypothetical protein